MTTLAERVEESANREPPPLDVASSIVATALVMESARARVIHTHPPIRRTLSH
jgi:hypothetical protein